jgi:bacillithiol biosynthesis cysteine-adding enzyme BshC
MKSSCLRNSSLPGASQLFSDFLYDFEKVRPFFERSFLDPASYEAAAREIQFPDERRLAMVEVLRKQNQTTAGAAAQLELLAKPGTVAVVTGQQVGLFGGPSYTVFKALTASVLAAKLNERGIPAVPVFWLATEDHDFPEINHAFSFGADHQPLRHEVTGAPLEPGPVGGIVPPLYPAEAAAASFAHGTFGDDIGAKLRAAYSDGQTLGAAFQSLMQALLPGASLLYLDPMDPAYREVAAPFLKEAAQRGEELGAALLDRNAELVAAGYHAQVHVEESTSLLFLLEKGARRGLKRHGGEYVLGKRRFSGEQLADMGAALSPNALLRPVMQDYTLPTVAYVGGPGELAYFAQSEVLYRKLLGRFPVATARAGFTIVDGRSAKLMERYGLQANDCFTGAAMREHISRKLIPEALQESMTTAKEKTVDHLSGLVGDLKRFDPTLAKALDKSQRKIFHQISKIEAKTVRETLRRNERAAADAAYLEGSLYPDHHLQERHYSILPFLAEHGMALLETVRENVHLECPDHIVLYL